MFIRIVKKVAAKYLLIRVQFAIFRIDDLKTGTRNCVEMVICLRGVRGACSFILWSACNRGAAPQSFDADHESN